MSKFSLQATFWSPAMRRQRSITISFRLPAELDADLAAAARGLGVSKHDYARTLVFQALRHTQSGGGSESHEDVRRAVVKVGSDLSLIAKAILIKVGRINPDDVEQWLADNQIGDVGGNH